MPRKKKRGGGEHLSPEVLLRGAKASRVYEGDGSIMARILKKKGKEEHWLGSRGGRNWKMIKKGRERYPAPLPQGLRRSGKKKEKEGVGERLTTKEERGKRWEAAAVKKATTCSFRSKEGKTL